MWRKSALSLFALGAAANLAAQAPARAGRPAAPQRPRVMSQQDIGLTAMLQARSGDSLGRLAAPEAAGRSANVVTARDNSELIKAIEHKIRCTCGCNLDVFTCRTTDFTCTTSPAMHQLVLARIDSGMTEAQVLDAFQKQYGEMIFMQPPKHGFNWAAYVMPFIGLGVGLGLVFGVVRRWARMSARAPQEPADQGAVPVVGATAEEMEKLKRELERFEA